VTFRVCRLGYRRVQKETEDMKKRKQEMYMQKKQQEELGEYYAYSNQAEEV
jgi:hypothetical protein